MPCLFRENRSKILPSYLNRMCARKQTESYGRLCIFLIAIRIRRISDKRTSYILLQRGFTATPARCWAALYGVSCLSVRPAKAVSLCVLTRATSRHVCFMSASGAIIAAATANSRRLSQRNTYKTCVSLVELGRTSRHFIVHFEKIPTKKFPRYGRCAQTKQRQKGAGRFCTCWLVHTQHHVKIKS